MASSIRAPVLAIFSGSARAGSVNTKLAKAAERLVQNTELGFGATTKFLDLALYDLPLYNPDVEANQGMPIGAMKLKEDLASTDGWIVCSPEYNGFVTPLLLNSFTWCSRGDAPEAGMYATFRDKTAIVLSASPGAMGGMRSLNPNRQLLTNLGVNVLPHSVAIGGAFQAFDETTGDLLDEKQQQMLTGAVHSLFMTTRDSANREVTCKLVEELKLRPVGDYGSVSVAN
jgi:chromate reductase